MHYCLDRSVFRNLSMRTCIFQADRCIGWQWHNLLFFFPYLLSAISIDIVPAYPLPAFCPRRPHSLRQRRSQRSACQSLILCKNTDQHPPLPHPTHSSHSSSLLYPTNPSTTSTSSHNKQNKRKSFISLPNFDSMCLPRGMHWPRLFPFPPFPMNKIYYCV